MIFDVLERALGGRRQLRRHRWRGRAPPAATVCGWGAAAHAAALRILVRSSSRWIIIAFSGFFTSCAMPAVSRPSATSLREYAIIDCTRDM